MKIKNLLLILICLAANSAIISNLECAAAAGAGAGNKAAKENAEQKDYFIISFTENLKPYLEYSNEHHNLVLHMFYNQAMEGWNPQQPTISKTLTFETINDRSFKFKINQNGRTIKGFAPSGDYFNLIKIEPGYEYLLSGEIDSDRDGVFMKGHLKLKSKTKI